MESHRTKPNKCPGCGAVHDAVTSMDLKAIKPSLGDIAICIDCGQINQYDKDLLFVKADPKELLDFASKEPNDFLDMQEYRTKIMLQKKFN